MATLTEIAERLLRRFKNVPNVTVDDASDWAEEALLAHGYMSTDDVPSDQTTILLLSAQAEGALQIALATAHYFNYTDGDESVDKSKVSEQYRKLAQDLRIECERKKAEIGGSSFKAMRRLDR